MASRVGFVNIEISFRQIYDISNLVCWLKDQIPTGNGHLEIFDKEVNDAYRKYLEASGYADMIFLRMEKR